MEVHRDMVHPEDSLRPVASNSSIASEASSSGSVASSPARPVNLLHRNQKKEASAESFPAMKRCFEVHDLNLLSYSGDLHRSPEATELARISSDDYGKHLRGSFSVHSPLSSPPLTNSTITSSASEPHHYRQNHEMSPPALTKQESSKIIQRLTNCKTLMDFQQFQKFVLLSYAMKHDLLEGQIVPLDHNHHERLVDDDDGEVKGESRQTSSKGVSEYDVFVSASDPLVIETFKSQLWTPGNMESHLDSGDLDKLEDQLQRADSAIGVYIIHVTDGDVKQLRKEVGHSHKSGSGKGKQIVCGCYLERKCKGWRLFEERFKDRAFCVLLKDGNLAQILDLHHKLPSTCLPSYEVGHIVMWPRDQLIGIDLGDFAKDIETNLPYEWPHDILCSQSQWRRMVFETQLKSLVQLTRVHSESAKERRKSLGRADSVTNLQVLINQAIDSVRHSFDRVRSAPAELPSRSTAEEEEHNSTNYHNTRRKSFSDNCAIC